MSINLIQHDGLAMLHNDSSYCCSCIQLMIIQNTKNKNKTIINTSHPSSFRKLTSEFSFQNAFTVLDDKFTLLTRNVISQ